MKSITTNSFIMLITFLLTLFCMENYIWRLRKGRSIHREPVSVSDGEYHFLNGPEPHGEVQPLVFQGLDNDEIYTYWALGNRQGGICEFWKFSIKRNEWAFVNRGAACESYDMHTGCEIEPPKYGEYFPNELSFPETRYYPAGVKINSNELLYGMGFHLYGGTSYHQTLNDLWVYNLVTDEYKKMAGNRTGDSKWFTPKCGEKGIYSKNNRMNSRETSIIGITPRKTEVFIFGGWGKIHLGWHSTLNDMWKFNYTNLQFQWAHGECGTSVSRQSYVLDDKEYHPIYPSARREMAFTWVTPSKFAIYGGSGYDLYGNYGPLDDLWVFDFDFDEFEWIAPRDDYAGSGWGHMLRCPNSASFVEGSDKFEFHPGNIPGGYADSIGVYFENSEQYVFYGGRKVHRNKCGFEQSYETYIFDDALELFRMVNLTFDRTVLVDGKCNRNTPVTFATENKFFMFGGGNSYFRGDKIYKELCVVDFENETIELLSENVPPSANDFPHYLQGASTVSVSILGEDTFLMFYGRGRPGNFEFSSEIWQFRPFPTVAWEFISGKIPGDTTTPFPTLGTLGFEKGVYNETWRPKARDYPTVMKINSTHILFMGGRMMWNDIWVYDVISDSFAYFWGKFESYSYYDATEKAIVSDDYHPENQPQVVYSDWFEETLHFMAWLNPTNPAEVFIIMNGQSIWMYHLDLAMFKRVKAGKDVIPSVAELGVWKEYCGNERYWESMSIRKNYPLVHRWGKGNRRFIFGKPSEPTGANSIWRLDQNFEFEYRRGVDSSYWISSKDKKWIGGLASASLHRIDDHSVLLVGGRVDTNRYVNTMWELHLEDRTFRQAKFDQKCSIVGDKDICSSKFRSECTQDNAKYPIPPSTIQIGNDVYSFYQLDSVEVWNLRMTLFECNDYYDIYEEACSSHGQCVDDVCVCQENYHNRFGENSTCSLWKCNGKWKNDSTVCGKRGICSNFDHCACDAGNFGKNCEVTSCQGVSSNASGTCAGHGKCSFHEYCTCVRGYSGLNCEARSVFILFGGYIIPPIIVGVLVLIVIIICIIVLLRLILKQRKKLSVFNEIELVIQEQRLAKEEGKAHIKLRKSAFELKKEDIQLVRMLGTGAQAVVYLAKYQNTLVAFKGFECCSGFENTMNFEEFEKEANIMANLSDAHVLKFFGCMTVPPRIGLVLEYCENGNLETFVTSRPYMSLEKRIHFALDIIDGIIFLHGRKIVHRDLKPENVLISKELVAKLSDFGLSRTLEGSVTKLTTRIGSSGFIAPEVSSSSGKYSFNADIFSFGVILWCLATGNFLPYEEQNCVGMLDYKLSTDPNFRPPLGNHAVFGENYWLKEIVKGCFEHGPEKRPSIANIKGSFKKNELNLKETRKENVNDVKKEIEELIVEIRNQGSSLSGVGKE